jgi:hypothetical protein
MAQDKKSVDSHKTIKSAQAAASAASGKSGEGATRPTPTPQTLGMYGKG